MGQEGFALLLKRLQGDDAIDGRRVTSDVELAARDSCRAVKT